MTLNKSNNRKLKRKTLFYTHKTQHSQKQKKKEKTKKNPRDGANFLSVFFYWWLIDIFRKGRNKQLEKEDIYNVVDGLESEQLGDRLERGWTNELLFAMDTSREPRVTNAIWFSFGSSFVILTASLVFVEAVYICQGLVLYWYVLSSVSREYLLSLCVSSALSILLHHGWNAIAMTVGTQLRVSCHSLLCKKLLKLDANYNRVRDINEKMSQVTEGLVLAELAIVKAPYILIGPFYALLVLTMLWAYFDRTAVVGVVIMLIVLIPLIVMSRQVASRLLQQCAPAKRERLFLLEEAASGMFQVKQRCLGQVFQNKIENFRRKECAATDACAILHTMVSTIQAHGTNIMTLLSVTLYTLAQQAFSEEEAFLILCLLQTLSNPLCTNLPMGFSLLTKLTRTIQVLQELLVMIDCPEQCKYEASNSPSESKVILIDASAECMTDGPTILTKISMNVKEGQILAVIGPWKSGKTPLLYLLQGEIQPSSGVVAVKGRTVFCPHTPWLLPAATVRENIICGKHINDQRLKLVLEVCGLVRDVQDLPKGDFTVIGTDDGVTLTLQQISKINLARTLYHESDIYLLDDPFRWLGRQVSDRIFTRCILKLLKDKTVILVTDKHRHIVKSDLIIALRNGKVEGYGTFSQLLDHISILEQASDLTSDDLDTDSDDSDVDEPTNSTSNNKFNIVECSYNYCRRYSYYPHPQSPVMKPATKILPYIEVSLPETKPITVWCQMFPVIGKTRSKFALSMIVLGLMSTQVFLTVWDFCFIVGLDSTANSTWHHWLKTPLNKEDTPLPALWYLSLGAVLVGVIVSYFVARTINKASNIVHDNLVKSFFQAPITLLDQQLLNKLFGCLTQDMRTLDEFLVPSFLNLIQHCLLLIGCLGLVVTSYYWFLLPTLILGLFTFYVFTTCLPTTKALETIESGLWRPVEAHFVVSEDEIVTLRSLKASEFYRRQFAEHQDRHTSSLFLLQSATEALSLWLSLACVVFTTCITFAFYLLNVERSIVALATYSCLVMTNMLPLVVADSTLASRLLETAGRMILTGQLPQESTETSLNSATDNCAFSTEGESVEVTNMNDWPFNGEISAVNLTLANNTATHAALESLQFTIKPRETVGIVGSGKSSLLAALLRLIEPLPGGCIRIDGIDIRDIPVKQLRAKICVVPRHPVLFAGSLRANLDPLNQLTDGQLWNALDKVGLREAISILPFGLLTESRHWDKTFTADQRQLLYLALAVTSGNRIIIVDLASRNTQPESERSLLNLVHEIFPSCTVVIMSERLRLVMATERVLVLESGRMAEYGHPYLLLQNKHSHLNKMIQEAGPSVLKAQLLDIAKNSYINGKRPPIKEESTESIDCINHI